MSTKNAPPAKTAVLLDKMIPHVRYEVDHILDFFDWGNGWCRLLHPELAQLTSESLLEAALIHFRCVIEFLSEKPKADQLRARDFLPHDWKWTVTDRAAQVDDLHDRVAHLGLTRGDVESEGSFEWLPWFTEQAPSVLLVFRTFLNLLQEKDERRYRLFVQGNDLRAELDRVGTEPE